MKPEKKDRMRRGKEMEEEKKRKGKKNMTRHSARRSVNVTKQHNGNSNERKSDYE